MFTSTPPAPPPFLPPSSSPSRSTEERESRVEAPLPDHSNTNLDVRNASTPFPRLNSVVLNTTDRERFSRERKFQITSPGCLAYEKCVAGRARASERAIERERERAGSLNCGRVPGCGYGASCINPIKYAECEGGPHRPRISWHAYVHLGAAVYLVHAAPISRDAIPLHSERARSIVYFWKIFCLWLFPYIHIHIYIYISNPPYNLVSKNEKLRERLKSNKINSERMKQSQGIKSVYRNNRREEFYHLLSRIMIVV